MKCSIEERLVKIEQEITKIDKVLAELPEGKIIVSKYQKRTKWYVRKGKECRYLPKAEKKLAEQLAYRKYMEALKKDYQKECIYLKAKAKYESGESQARAMLLDDRYADLLKMAYKPWSEYVEEWQAEKYERNPEHPEDLIHLTHGGYMVRSKSEILIAEELIRQHIPHRYECPLELNGFTVYPDFTILHPNKKKIIYWEHLGMMDDPGYVNKSMRKLERYAQNGIYPNVNLILTYETKDNPLSLQQIEYSLEYILECM